MKKNNLYLTVSVWLLIITGLLGSVTETIPFIKTKLAFQTLFSGKAAQ
jgi:hypothetical protein